VTATLMFDRLASKPDDTHGGSTESEEKWSDGLDDVALLVAHVLVLASDVTTANLGGIEVEVECRRPVGIVCNCTVDDDLGAV